MEGLRGTERGDTSRVPMKVPIECHLEGLGITDPGGGTHWVPFRALGCDRGGVHWHSAHSGAHQVPFGGTGGGRARDWHPWGAICKD